MFINQHQECTFASYRDFLNIMVNLMSSYYWHKSTLGRGRDIGMISWVTEALKWVQCLNKLLQLSRLWDWINLHCFYAVYFSDTFNGTVTNGHIMQRYCSPQIHSRCCPIYWKQELILNKFYAHNEAVVLKFTVWILSQVNGKSMKACKISRQRQTHLPSGSIHKHLLLSTDYKGNLALSFGAQVTYTTKV